VNQKELSDYVKNPKNIAKAVEGSMDKRLSKMSNEKTLTEIRMFLTRSLSHTYDCDEVIIEGFPCKCGSVDRTMGQVQSLILSEARRIGLEAIGEDDKHGMTDLALVISDGINQEKFRQRKRLLELTGGDNGKVAP